MRVAFGVVLIWVAPVSRAPRTLKVVGVLIVIAGIATAATGLTAIERARALIEWWLAQGPGVVRLTGVLVLAVGGLIALRLCSRSFRRAEPMIHDRRPGVVSLKRCGFHETT